ncbi:hypothetical protein FKM82_020383 [Ascaphus truei]
MPCVIMGPFQSLGENVSGTATCARGYTLEGGRERLDLARVPPYYTCTSSYTPHCASFPFISTSYWDGLEAHTQPAAGEDFRSKPMNGNKTFSCVTAFVIGPFDSGIHAAMYKYMYTMVYK